ncbi:MAG: hypothetical protein IT457_04080 [Planctomycetes bacterium]|nr:hypothetical protein [Planctomycetota bacterium]
MSGRPAWCTLGLLAALGAVACAGTPEGDPASLTEQVPLPFSVLVAGGGVVEATAEPSAAPTRAYARTFAGADGEVLVDAATVGGALRAARVFARALADDAGEGALGARLRDVRDVLAPDDPLLSALLARARAAGHDYVLVVQRVVDGAIEERGINDRWPLTAATWLLVGLGALVQDHSFESRASLEAMLFDVEEGRLVYRAVGSGAVVELALTGRGNLWSFVQSILVPPFLVASREDQVVANVRDATVSLLVAALARDLKGSACRRAIADRARVAIEIEFVAGRARVRARAGEGLGSVATRIDGVAIDDDESRRFARALLESQREGDGGQLLAEADFAWPPGARYLQVLVRTVSGVVASSTVEALRR